MATAEEAVDDPVLVDAPPRPDEDGQWEFVDGQWVETPLMSAFAGLVASRLATDMNVHARAHDLGEAVAEIMFALRPPRRRSRRPDVAFVSFQRWPKDTPFPQVGEAWKVVPDLAVEVIS